MAKVFHVILTGGVGSRLWPLSRRSRPKQYLEIFPKSSLFELAIKRNLPFSDGLIIVGNRENREFSESIAAKFSLPVLHKIVEATPRNTAPAITFAALLSEPENILLVTPADHIIEEGEEYTKAIQQALKLAGENHLVTFGVKPLKPETGYGYIEYEENKVLSFREKPGRATAEEFLKSGRFLWNSGMFCFKAGVFLKELEKYAPEVYEKSLAAWQMADQGFLEHYSSMEIPSVSIDYALMEKTDRLKVVDAKFKWSDMGSFEAVYDYLKENGHALDTNANMQIGDFKPTFFVGVNNCILISTKDANLIVSKEASQDVKAVYQYLEKNNPELI